MVYVPPEVELELAREGIVRPPDTVPAVGSYERYLHNEAVSRWRRAVDKVTARLTPVDLDSYDRFIVMFSGGKDSLACLLHLLRCGVPKSKIELWHHLVDGREGSTLMDWPCTEDYCRKLAAAFELPLYFSWKVNGFEGELLRDKAPTAPVCFETPDGLVTRGGKGANGGNQLWPQVGSIADGRWCSAYLKIMVAEMALRNQLRFVGTRTLVVTGERAEEGTARAAYAVFEPHKTDLRNGRRPRHIDAWRPVHGWTRQQVWAIIEEFKINPHPAYRALFGRLSCMKCIFGNKHHWATVRHMDPQGFAYLASAEANSGQTIKRHLSVVQLADAGTPYEMSDSDLAAAMSRTFDEPMFIDPWVPPRGAYGDSCGPT